MEELNVDTITKRSIRGIIVLISRTFSLNLISFATRLLIYSILIPSDVGIYTAVIAIQRVISFFTDFGFGAALIQKKETLTEEDLQTTFTIQALVTFVIFASVVVLRTIFISFFNLSEAGGRLLLVLVFTIFLSSFKTIPSILLERSIRFGKLVVPQIVESAVFNVVLVVLIFRGYKIDSYTWAFLASGLIGIPFYYFISPWKLGVGIYKDSLKHLKYGTQFQAKNILATIKDDLLTVILVRFLSFTEIGYIGFAQGIAFFMYRYIVDSVTKVTFSTYARLQEHTIFLKKAIEKSLLFVSTTMFPILIGLVVIAPYVIQYFPKWHNKWEPAILSLMFFCFNAIVSSLSGILVNVLDATGRVKTTLKLMMLWTILTWVLTPLFIVLFGYNGVAIASFLVTLTIIITVRLVRQIVEFDFFGSIGKSLFASCIMGIFVYVLAKVLISSFLTLTSVVLLGGVFYILLMALLAKKELKHTIETVFARK